jgi:predicted Rossmann-fold nucleotide-binding protein
MQMVNARQFSDSLLEQLDRAVAERFMDERHLAMWQVVARRRRAFESAQAWAAEARTFATQKALADGRPVSSN